MVQEWKCLLSVFQDFIEENNTIGKECVFMIKKKADSLVHNIEISWNPNDD